MVVSQVLIDAPLLSVWEAVADLPTHGEWMVDAESVEFLSRSTVGIGARMEVTTRLGPLRTIDRIEITEWDERRAIGVRHSGLVKGNGRFQLDPMAGGTRLRWSEDLTFPIWWGGPLAGHVAGPMLAWVWRRNLAALKHRLERRQGTGARSDESV